MVGGVGPEGDVGEQWGTAWVRPAPARPGWRRAPMRGKRFGCRDLERRRSPRRAAALFLPVSLALCYRRACGKAGSIPGWADPNLPGEIDDFMNPRIVIFEEEQRLLEELCAKLARAALAKSIFLLDKNGQIIVALGEIATVDTTSLASLVAGTTAATSSLAKLLGEEEFPVHFHEGKRDNLHISLVDAEHILAVIFDQRSSLGLVRLRVKKASEHLVEVFEQLTKKQAEDQGGAYLEWTL